MFFATLLVVSFGYLLATPTPVYAAATWEGDNLVNEGETYLPFERGNASGLDAIPNSAQLYRAFDGGSGSGQAKFIYFESGAPKSAGEATYVTYTLNPPNEYSDASNEQTVEVTPVSAAAQDQPGGETSCAIEGGAGWIICPVTRTMAAAMDAIYTAVAAFLVVTPMQATDQGAMYRMWSLVRNVANICFIIAMLIIIYSHLTDIGLSNYNLKKMLPRLFVAAILVNVSYWICAVAIDISNILGYAVQDLFNGVRTSLVGPEGNTWDITWESMASFLLSGGSLAAGAGIAAYVGTTALATAAVGGGVIWLFIPILLSVLFVVLVTFLILAARQAIITILVVLAPLAFVAFLLPNTEKWFDKWRSALFVLLLLFPAFSLVFGGAQLAATLIIQNATGPNALNMIILAMGVQVAPLAITPLLLKLGGGVLNRFANVVNNPAKGVFDRGKNYARTRSEQTKAEGMRRLDMRAKERGFVDGRPGKSTKPTRRGRFAENAANRMNPYNAAYNREYNRREREGMKTANEAMSDGLFQQTAAGNRIYARSQDAGLEKHAGEEGNRRRYQEGLTVGTTPYDAYRRGLHHSAHEDKSKAEIFEASLTAHSERDFREKLNNAATPQYQQLRDLKIRTDVDKGVADLYTKRVDATGSAALAETVLTDRNLKAVVIDTHADQGRASQANELVEDAAKANWEKLTLNDRTIYSRQLERQGNAKELKSLQAEWDSILMEAASGRTDDYNKKFGPITSDVAASVDIIQTADQNIAVEEHRKARADNVAKVQLYKNLKANDALLERAGGIDETGRIKVISELTKAGSALHMQNVEAIESVMSNEGYELDEEKLILQGKPVRGSTTPPTDMERHAAMRRILLTNGNNWAAQEVYDYVISQGLKFDSSANNGAGGYFDENGVEITDSDEVSSRRDLQQIWIDAQNKSGLKVDYLSGTQRGLAEAGLLQRPDNSRTASEQAIIDDISKAKIKGERIAGADIDIIDRQLQVFSDPSNIAELDPAARKKYVETLNRTLEDPLLGGRMSEREWSHSKILANVLDDSDTRPIDEKLLTYVNRDGETKVLTPYLKPYNYLR